MKNPLPERRRGGNPSAELAELRRMMSAAVSRYPRNPRVILDYRVHRGVRCLEITPPRADNNMVYFHGGGFRMGSPELVAGFASTMAVRLSCRIILPFYGLAPEHPFPGALLDGCDVIEEIGKGGQLWLAGDSAGGNLAAVLARRYCDKVAGVMLFSPWLDLRVEARSYHTNAGRDTLFSRASAQDAAALYLQGHSPHDGDVSPLLDDVAKMPLVHMAVGSGEVLLDDALDFARVLAEHQRRVVLQVIPGMAHVEPVLIPNCPHTDHILDLAQNIMRIEGN